MLLANLSEVSPAAFCRCLLLPLLECVAIAGADVHTHQPQRSDDGHETEWVVSQIGDIDRNGDRVSAFCSSGSANLPTPFAVGAYSTLESLQQVLTFSTTREAQGLSIGVLRDNDT